MGVTSQRRKWADRAARVMFVIVLVGGLYWLWTAPASKPYQPANPSFWDRAFSDRLLDLFRVGLVAAAAFVAASIVQRLVLAELAFKGPAGVELAELPRVAPIVAQATEPIRDEVQKATEELQTAIEGLRTETNTKFRQLTLEVIQPLTDQMEALQEQTGAERE